MAAPIRRRRSWSTRLFRALLALYPGEFRDEYGRELALVFADRYRDATGIWQRAGVWHGAIYGLLREAPKEHVQLVAHDLRFAARMLRRTPGFATTVVVTLALGIGANTAIFQLINAVGLRSLPVRNPSELVEVRIAGGNQGFGVNPDRYGQLPRPVWDEIRAHQQAFSSVFAWRTRDFGVGEFSDLRRANGIAVSGEFFRALGVQPFRGRVIEPDDDESPCPSSRAVVSYAYWQHELGGRALGDGARLRINGDLHEIIGVTPPGFFGLAVGESFDIATPLCQPAEVRRELFDLVVMGRLGPGWTLERASAHLDALSPGIFEVTAPAGYSSASLERFKSFRLAVYPASTGVSVLRTRYETALQLLFAITGLVLLIACANLTNLMLARAIAREREVAVRLALGGSRSRLLRQFVAESAVLAVIGAALGIGVAQVVSRVLVWTLSAQEGASLTLSLATDWRMLGFAAVITLGTCVVLGVLPAIRATGIEPAATIKTGGRAHTADRRRFAAEHFMVVTQIAVSLVLLVGALLFVRSFYNLVTFDPGMRQTGITIAMFGFQRSGLTPDRFTGFRRQLLAEVTAIPGVHAAGTTSNMPLVGGSWSHGVQIGASTGSARFTWVSPGYFDAMGIRILEGRDFTLRDTQQSPRVAVVNQAFARQFSSGASPIGLTLRTSPEPRYPSTVYEIVGTIPDTQYNGLRGDAPPMVFAPDSQHPSPGPSAAMMVYSNADPTVMAATIRRTIATAHPEIFMDFADFQARIRSSLVRERLLATLAGFFGALAAVLAAVGLYGMISFIVAQRQHEIGVRLALGARRRQVVAMVMHQALLMLVVGVAVGTGLSLLAGQSVGALLFGLKPHDLPTLMAAGSLLAVIAAIATVIPARRASKLDPLVSLRSE